MGFASLNPSYRTVVSHERCLCLMDIIEPKKCPLSKAFLTILWILPGALA